MQHHPGLISGTTSVVRGSRGSFKVSGREFKFCLIFQVCEPFFVSHVMSGYLISEFVCLAIITEMSQLRRIFDLILM